MFLVFVGGFPFKTTGKNRECRFCPVATAGGGMGAEVGFSNSDSFVFCFGFLRWLVLGRAGRREVGVWALLSKRAGGGSQAVDFP